MKLDTRPRSPSPDVARTSRGPGIDIVWASLAVLLPVLVVLLGRLGSVDLAYHLRAGQEVLRTHLLPGMDTYTFTAAGAPWRDQQWGAQILLAACFRAGGFPALLTLWAALVGTTCGLCYRACRVKGASAMASALLVTAGLAVMLQLLALRPQLFAVPLFAGTVLLLTTRRTHPRRLWAIPFIAVMWANLHGSFVLAPMLVGLALVETPARKDRADAKRLVVVGLLTLLGTCVTPFGFHVWSYALAIARDPQIRGSVTEWAPVSVSTYTGIVFFISVAAVVAWLARRGSATSWPDLLWLVVFAGLSLMALRSVIWWALVAPVVLAGLMPPRGERDSVTDGRRDRGGSPLLNVAIVITLVAACIVLLPFRRPGAPASLLRMAPQGLVRAAASEVGDGGHALVYQPWGSWFEYASPSTQVFVDSRIELFPAQVWDDYAAVSDAREGWQGILDHYGVDAVVFDPQAWTALAGAIATDPGWKLAYRDADGIVYVRAAAA